MRTLTKDEVNRIFQYVPGGEDDNPTYLYDRDVFWRNITLEEDDFNPGYAMVSQIRNHLFRTIQHILGHIILYRNESSNVQVEEIHLMWSVLTNTHVALAH